jgi:holo-[acyl-carrier protein] synthase
MTLTNFIKGVGVDIAKIPRFKRIIESHESSFIRKILHEKEISEYQEMKFIENKTKFLASRWSVKEALVKATGDKSIVFSKIYLQKNDDGKPFLKFDPEYLKQDLKFKDIENSIHISISHEDEFAIAFVVLENLNKMI